MKVYYPLKIKIPEHIIKFSFTKIFYIFRRTYGLDYGFLNVFFLNYKK